MPVQQMQSPDPFSLQGLLGSYNTANSLYKAGSAISSLMSGSTASEAGSAASSSSLGGLGSMAGGLGATMLFFSLMQGGTPTIQDLLNQNPYLSSLDQQRMQSGASPLSGILSQGIDLGNDQAFFEAVKPDIQESLRKGLPVTTDMLNTLRGQYQQQSAAIAPYESPTMRKAMSFMQGKGPVDPLGGAAPIQPQFQPQQQQQQGGIRSMFMGASPTTQTRQQPSNLFNSFSTPGSFFGTTGDPRFNF